MLTAGEVINYALRGYANVSLQTVDDNTELRVRAWMALREIMAKAWTLAPHWWKLGNGTVSLSASAGYGNMPSDFGHLGTEGQVYISGKQLPPLSWIQPDLLEALRISTSQTAPDPTQYTIRSKTAAGLSQIQVWPTNASALTLLVKNYTKRCPFPVDRPTPAPSAVDSGSVGLLNGAYTWKQTYVTADGETEPGPASVSLSLSLKRATVTLRVSESRAVTSRKLYRPVASESTYKLVATISDNTTTTYTDNVADGSLGATAPTTAEAVTGTEVFPEDYHETVLLAGVVMRLARAQGDLRDAGFSAEWTAEVRRMWAEQRQGQNFPEGMPSFGGGAHLSINRRWRLLE